jgi:hypothetical protein
VETFCVFLRDSRVFPGARVSRTEFVHTVYSLQDGRAIENGAAPEKPVHIPCRDGEARGARPRV